MRIAALYAYHSLDRGWSCPISLLNEFERMGHQVTSYNLYVTDVDGKGIGYTDSGLRRFLDEQNNYDLFIHMDYGMFSSRLFSDVKIPMVIETGDDPQRFSQNFLKAQYFDFIFTPDKRCHQKYLEHGLNSIWLTHWADPYIHTTFSIPNNDFETRLVVTSCEEGRGEGIIPFLGNQLGDLWEDDRYFYGVDHARFMLRGSIIFQKSQFGEITRRPFEAAACKRMVLMDEIDPSTGIYDIFKPNQDAVYYKNWQDALDKILYYKDHRDELEKIANNGYNVVANGHFTTHRAKDLLDFVGVL